MPPLRNARHEKFCQELAQGRSASEAYINAGFKASRQNAGRLRTKDDVAARIPPYRDCVSARARGNTEILEPRERPLVARGTHAIVALLVTGSGGFSKPFSSPRSAGVDVSER